MKVVMRNDHAVSKYLKKKIKETLKFLNSEMFTVS
jgi:hypothetical protein